MARYENEMPKRSIFQRRIISKRNSTPILPTFLTEHEQKTRNVGMKSPPPDFSPGLADRPSSSTYMSWWMPLPPLTPTTPHQTTSMALDNKNEELAFQFPIKGPHPYDGSEEYTKVMVDGKGNVPRSKVSENDKEKRKYHRVGCTNSSPATFNFLPPIPKGPVCLVATRGLSEGQTTKKICDSPSPHSRRESELLEGFVGGLGEPSEEENDYESILSPTVAEINFFLDKIASRCSYKDENDDGNKGKSDVKETKSIGVSNSLTVPDKETLPQVQGTKQNQI
ncbi:uncharacterized protein LOC116287437 [Actinia tenebrosa]|uniref:Uncharacterized protein LOC116287437 n=1 Tax=Actinia tenebrosa TaxID=6105 RepID=A0A6P8HBB8_ACTTE|nr:uncharacterized protein LOC116287437 [Actinia tenebrosa]